MAHSILVVAVYQLLTAYLSWQCITQTAFWLLQHVSRRLAAPAHDAGGHIVEEDPTQVLARDVHVEPIYSLGVSAGSSIEAYAYGHGYGRRVESIDELLRRAYI